MQADDVLAVLAALEAAGVRCWLDGGWGVDALLGRQTRDHGDLDLAVPAPHLAATGRVLADLGYEVVSDELPTRLALRDGAGREVDLHPVAPTADGGGDQVLPDGTRYRYAPPVKGQVGGRRVRCCPPQDQLDQHLGYPPRPQDRADVAALAQRFGLAVPPPYASG